MNEKFKKVKFALGDNDKYDYYILAEKKEIEIDENSLAYKVTNENKTTVIYHNGIIGNFDFLLEKKIKEECKGWELASKEDIEFEL